MDSSLTKTAKESTSWMKKKQKEIQESPFNELADAILMHQPGVEPGPIAWKAIIFDYC